MNMNRLTTLDWPGWMLRVVWSLMAMFCILPGGHLRGQDVHFSQYDQVPLHLNPALAGIGPEDVRFTAVMRSQWYAALVPYRTVMISADRKFWNPRKPEGFFSGGLSFYYDQAGEVPLSTAVLAAAGSYTWKVNSQNFFSAGMQMAVGQRRLEAAGFTFDSQYDGEVFDPTLPTHEQLDRESLLYPDLAVGLNWHARLPDRRTRADVGIGLFHVLAPRQNFYMTDKDSRMLRRFSLYFLPTIRLGEKVDMSLRGTAQIQGAYFEALAGGGLRLWLRQTLSRELALELGAGYRFNVLGDAVIPYALLQTGYWQFGFTWDINVSDFSVATNRNGGPELTLRHQIFHVKPLNEFKICPIL